jgi:hypothetical protein
VLHSEHVAVAAESEPIGPYSPALHGDPRHVKALVVEYVPATQMVQTEASFTEYVPAWQSEQ